MSGPQAIHLSSLILHPSSLTYLAMRSHPELLLLGLHSFRVLHEVAVGVDDVAVELRRGDGVALRFRFVEAVFAVRLDRVAMSTAAGAGGEFVAPAVDQRNGAHVRSLQDDFHRVDAVGSGGGPGDAGARGAELAEVGGALFP